MSRETTQIRALVARRRTRDRDRTRAADPRPCRTRSSRPRGRASTSAAAARSGTPNPTWPRPSGRRWSRHPALAASWPGRAGRPRSPRRGPRRRGAGSGRGRAATSRGPAGPAPDTPRRSRSLGRSRLAAKALAGAAGRGRRAVIVIRPSTALGPGRPPSINLHRLVETIRRRRFVMTGNGADPKTTSHAGNLVAMDQVPPRRRSARALGVHLCR